MNALETISRINEYRVRYVCTIKTETVAGIRDAGHGLLISPTAIVTCAHVVEQFFKMSNSRQQIKTNPALRIKFSDGAELSGILSSDVNRPFESSTPNFTAESNTENIADLHAGKLDIVVLEIQKLAGVTTMEVDGSLRGFYNIVDQSLDQLVGDATVLAISDEYLLAKQLGDEGSPITAEATQLTSTVGTVSQDLFSHRHSTEPGCSGAPIFCVRTGLLVGLHRGVWPPKASGSKPYGIFANGIIRQIYDSEDSRLFHSLKNVKPTHLASSFPVRINETFVVNREFLIGQLDELISDRTLKMINIFGPSNSGKSFCIDIIENCLGYDNDQCCMIKMAKLPNGTSATREERRDHYRELMLAAADRIARHSSDGETVNIDFEADSSKLERNILAAAEALSRRIEMLGTPVVYIVDDDFGLSDEFSQVLYARMIRRSLSSIYQKLIVTSQIMLSDETRYGTVADLVRDKDNDRKVRNINLGQHRISLNDIERATSNVLKVLPAEVRAQLGSYANDFRGLMELLEIPLDQVDGQTQVDSNYSLVDDVGNKLKTLYRARHG